MKTLICHICNHEFEVDEIDIEKTTICPHCDSTDISILLILEDKISINEIISGKSNNRLSGKKKPAIEFQAGQEKSVLLQKWVDKERVIDRENNKYYERVADPDTGEVLHECKEPLSDHFGHGSVKLSLQEEVKHD